MLRELIERLVATTGPERAPLLFFPHIPKAGGTTLKQIVFKKYGRNNCLTVWDTNFGAEIDVDEFPSADVAALKHFDAVVGHLPVHKFFSNQSILRQVDTRGVIIVASVRHPIERMISLYNYMTTYDRHPGHHTARSLPAVDFLKYQSANYQSKFLSRRDGDDAGGLLPDDITIFPMESAVRGFIDVLEVDVDEKDVRVLNKTEDIAGDKPLFGIDDLSATQIRDLCDKHRVDMDLYEAARRAYDMDPA